MILCGFLWASQYKTLYLLEYYPNVPYRNHTIWKVTACLCLFDLMNCWVFPLPHHPYRTKHLRRVLMRAKSGGAGSENPQREPSKPAPPPGTKTLLTVTRTTPTMHTQSTRRAQQGTRTVHQHIHRVAGAIRHETLNRLNAGTDQEPRVQHVRASLRFE